MERLSQFSAIATREKIDGGTGIIYGVSVITKGEAQGKNAGTWIDATTLSEICSVAKTYTDGVKVKLSINKEHDGSLGQVCGVLRNFTISGDRVRADLHLLKSDKNYDKILEMSAIMPSEFGLSVVIPKEIEEIDGRECLRCREIYSIDLVQSPAANPSGLFSTDGGHGGHLVEKDGDKHLPTEKNGKFDPHLAGAAWAALHGGYRGNKYEGPDKEKAIAKLKRLYKEHGMETPDEKESSMSKIKYKDGDSGPHHEECECEACMAKHSKKRMSGYLAGLLGLSETATEEEVAAAFKASRQPADQTELTRKMEALSTELTALKTADANTLALSKKTEIDNLLTEASREGKVVPLDNDDLYMVKDGVCTIKTEPSQLRKMLSKLPAGQIKLSKRAVTPVNADGKAITDRNSAEFKAFMASKKEEGAAELTRIMLAQPTGLTRN